MPTSYPALIFACPSTTIVTVVNEYQRDQLALLKRIARERGGWCESKRYVSSKTKMRFRCRAGHVWKAVSTSIKHGSWCAACANVRPLGIAFMQKLGRENGATCLSTRYVNYETKLEWRCDQCGHEFSASPGAALSGTWCPLCSPRRRGSIEEQQEISAERGGRCLSTVYVSSEQKLEYECAQGHRWSARPDAIKSGSWCPTCANRVMGDLAEPRRHARRMKGELLSTEYKDGKSKLRWRCAKGHEWDAAWNNVRRGTWCPKCNRCGAGRKKKRLTIEDMQETAASRRGFCRSKVYVNSKTPLLWECEEGHQWEQVQSPVRRGSWCPHCAGVARGSLEELQVLAANKGGLCLEKKYLGVEAKHRFECADGHRWSAPPKRIKRGSWCPTCSGRERGSIGVQQAKAAERGGKCLSTEYHGTRVHLLYECALGHVWAAVPAAINRGSWCPTCFVEKRKARTKARRRPRGGPA